MFESVWKFCQPCLLPGFVVVVVVFFSFLFFSFLRLRFFRFFHFQLLSFFYCYSPILWLKVIHRMSAKPLNTLNLLVLVYITHVDKALRLFSVLCVSLTRFYKIANAWGMGCGDIWMDCTLAYQIHSVPVMCLVMEFGELVLCMAIRRTISFGRNGQLALLVVWYYSCLGISSLQTNLWQITSAFQIQNLHHSFAEWAAFPVIQQRKNVKIQTQIKRRRRTH